MLRLQRAWMGGEGMMRPDEEAKEVNQVVSNKFSPFTQFVWYDDDKAFTASGGKLIRAIIFRALSDSVDRDIALRTEARAWLRNNMHDLWDVVFHGSPDPVFKFVTDVWNGDNDVTYNEFKKMITSAMFDRAVVDLEGESRFDPHQHKRN